ncbi:hypothetical protein [Glutamicibacter sp. BW77]|uniref:hypothetical protein n=1 Tax=Glutamicibacter TaxID=1742989 RepID=UPI000BB7309B|nr:hypothetical protein [Glutamicibacter sp. BW77]PCC33457.1 hypothetical protein CIK74_12315 [Glutamicibacter sp. BW77]
MNKVLKLVAATASAVGLLAGGALVAAPAANAATACSANRVLVDDRGWLPDSHKATGRCSKIDGNKKVRISLDRIADFDYHTSWFTRTNTTYSTNQSTLTRGAYYTVRNV